MASGIVGGLLWRGSRRLASKPKAHTMFAAGGNYSRYRPTYPKSLFDEIERYAAKTRRGKPELAVDIGSGTGQATVVLRDYYQRAIGVEASESQRKSADQRGLSNQTLSFAPGFQTVLNM